MREGRVERQASRALSYARRARDPPCCILALDGLCGLESPDQDPDD